MCRVKYERKKQQDNLSFGQNKVAAVIVLATRHDVAPLAPVGLASSNGPSAGWARQRR